MHACTHVYMHVCINVCMYKWTYAYMNACLNVCSMYIYIYPVLSSHSMTLTSNTLFYVYSYSVYARAYHSSPIMRCEHTHVLFLLSTQHGAHTWEPNCSMHGTHAWEASYSLHPSAFERYRAPAWLMITETDS